MHESTAPWEKQMIQLTVFLAGAVLTVLFAPAMPLGQLAAVMAIPFVSGVIVGVISR